MAIVVIDHRSWERRHFDVLSEALAWGRHRAAVLADAGKLRGPFEDPYEDGILLMGQVTDETGEVVEAEALTWVGLEISEAGNVARQG